MSKPNTSSALRRLSRQGLDPAKIAEAVNEINAGTDRSMAILWGSMVEEALRTAITRTTDHLSDAEENSLFDMNAPLASFSGKIMMAYAMKIITKEQRSDLDRIREIRNAFAHSIAGVSFSTKEVIDVCLLLSFAKLVQCTSLDNCRSLFSIACFRLWGTLGQYDAVLAHSPGRLHYLPQGYTLSGEETGPWPGRFP